MRFSIFIVIILACINFVYGRVARDEQSVWDYQQLLQELQDKIQQDPIVTNCPLENTGFQLISE